MMKARRQSKECIVEHVGQPGEGVPIALIYRGKCPDDGFWSQSVFNMRIFKDISAVIVIHKIMADNLTVNRKGDKSEKQADPYIRPDLTGCISAASAEDLNKGVTPG